MSSQCYSMRIAVCIINKQDLNKMHSLKLTFLRQVSSIGIKTNNGSMGVRQKRLPSCNKKTFSFEALFKNEHDEFQYINPPL